MKEFINPKSMLTPGVAGSLMMFLVNGITFQFPEVPPRYLALFLSFMIGAVVWLSETKGKSLVLQKAVFWVLNSLVILVVGFGTANLAADVASSQPDSKAPHAVILPLISDALAQENPVATRSGSPQSVEALKQQLEAERIKNECLIRELESAKQEKPPMSEKEPAKDKQFFKRW